jgi:hypothetical protein
MPTYLYCVLTAGSEAPVEMPTGVGGERVRVLAAGPLAAWVESVAHRTVRPTVEGARVHDAVTDIALATGMTPLPARFGQTFASDDACRESLVEQRDRLTRDLERVRGLVEMRVVASLRASEKALPLVALPTGDDASLTEDLTPGRAYMRELSRTRELERIMHTLAAAVRERLTETVGAFVRGEALSLAPLPAAVLTVSHLIARDVITRYRAALLDAQLHEQVERFVVSGPGAPYHFVTPPA